MKKTLALMLALTMALISSAKVVTFDFTKPATLDLTPASKASTGVQIESKTLTMDGVTMSFVKPSGNGAKLWTKTDKSTELRLYTPSKMKITALEGRIKAVRFTASQFTIEGLDVNKQVNCDTTEITFAVPAKAGACYITQVTVWIDEQPEVLTVDTISVKQAVQRIKDNKKHACYVKGIAGAAFSAAGKYNVYLYDIDDPAKDSLEGFDIKRNASKIPFNSVDEMQSVIEVGDTVLIFADGLDLFGGSIYETISGYFVKTLGKASYQNLNDMFHFCYAVRDSTSATQTGWTVYMQPSEEQTYGLQLRFTNKTAQGIAGNYSLASVTYTKADQTVVTSLSATVSLKYAGTNVVGYNTYEVTVKFSGNDGLQYRLGGDYEIVGYTNDFSEEIELTDDMPYKPIPSGAISVAEALAIGQTLSPAAKKTETTSQSYSVVGYVAKVKTAVSNGSGTWYMSDNPTATYGDFQAYNCTIDVDVVAGMQVVVEGPIANYNGGTFTSIEISKGKAYPVKATGLEELNILENTSDVRKVLIDGQLFIIRDGVAYTLDGVSL